MIVYALIGPCGAGKTSLLGKMPGTIRTHKEGYVQKDQMTVFMDNKLYLSKLRYLSSWYLEMIKLKREKHRKILSDRCPFDVAAYVADQEKQHDIVAEYMSELEAEFSVKVRTIYVRVQFGTARKRVLERLQREPWRMRYHEDDEAFLHKTFTYYENHVTEWEHIVDNEADLEAAAIRLKKIVAVRQ